MQKQKNKLQFLFTCGVAEQASLLKMEGVDPSHNIFKSLKSDKCMYIHTS